jgi:hypothetical protein
MTPDTRDLLGRLAELRSAGWMVAVHNDYHQDGKLRTFWLFTKGDRAIKGEADTDAEAIALVAEQVADSCARPEPAQCGSTSSSRGAEFPCLLPAGHPADVPHRNHYLMWWDDAKPAEAERGAEAGFFDHPFGCKCSLCISTRCAKPSPPAGDLGADLMRSACTSAASFIAEIDASSKDVADYLAQRFWPLAGLPGATNALRSVCADERKLTKLNDGNGPTEIVVNNRGDLDEWLDSARAPAAVCGEIDRVYRALDTANEKLAPPAESAGGGVPPASMWISWHPTTTDVRAWPSEAIARAEYPHSEPVEYVPASRLAHADDVQQATMSLVADLRAKPMAKRSSAAVECCGCDESVALRKLLNRARRITDELQAASGGHWSDAEVREDCAKDVQRRVRCTGHNRRRRT